MPPANPTHYVRGQYDGYLNIDGVAPESTTENHAAMRLDIDNWRWAGVPWFIRTGKKLPSTQTELRAVFREPPRLGFMEHGSHRRPEPNQFVVKLDPSTGVREIIDAHRADADGPVAATLDVELADQGGEAPTPYEVLLLDAIRGDSSRFTRQDAVEETWRIFQPLLEQPPPVHPYAPGSWGPAEGDGLVRGFRQAARPVGAVMSPTGSSRTGSSKAAVDDTRDEAVLQSAAMPSPFPPIADYAFLSDCHTGLLMAPDGSVNWLCVPRFDAPSVFGTLLDRQAGDFRFGPFGINVPTARVYEPGTNILLTTWKTASGWVIVRDALILGPRRGVDKVTPHTRPPTDEDAEHLLVRVAMCIEGEVEMELTWVSRPSTTGAQPRNAVDGRARMVTPPTRSGAGVNVTIRLQTDMAVGTEGERVRARHELKQGEQIFCSLSWAEELASPQTLDEANERLAATAHFWRTWAEWGQARILDQRAGAIRSSARRSRSRVSPTCRPAPRSRR